MEMLSRRVLIVLLVAALVVPLGACGRKGDLEPPPGSTYPKKYPAE